MLEKYVEGFEEEAFISEIRKARGIKTKKMVLAIARKEIPLEDYYQNKIKKAVAKKYPMAFVRKITQGCYSEGGTPDLMVIISGIYIGLEVKRPLVGEVSKLQEQTIAQIRDAGGVAEVVRWPEEAIKVIEERLSQESYIKHAMNNLVADGSFQKFCKEYADEVAKNPPKDRRKPYGRNRR